MALVKGMSLQRLKTIYQRQRNASWDTSYIPSMLATPREAPAISRAYILTPAKLGGRETHLLSSAELSAALLGLYCPQVVGLQEQRMLSPEPTLHPLWTFPNIERDRLLPLQGVIEVADRLGCLDVLPKIWVPEPQSPSQKIPMVFPWLGDLLWAVTRGDGSVYCVNWSIKDTQEGFTRNTFKLSAKTKNIEAAETLLARHEIEETYYKDTKILTIRVAGENIDKHVRENLRQLFAHHRRKTTLNESQKNEVILKLQYGLQEGLSGKEVIEVLAARKGYSIADCCTLFYQAIWNRELRLDLFRPVLINCPMRPEIQDVAEKYADWFREVA